MNKFEEFRHAFPLFIYKSCTITETSDSVNINYVFDIPNLAQFTPGWSFPKPENLSVKNDSVFEH
ncbi:MAG: hypothetical protein K2J37_03580, partial [Ruminococcus sp.]|nr:hypothetical protein [Ruminococcus sp.]